MYNIIFEPVSNLVEEKEENCIYFKLSRGNIPFQI